MNYISLYNINFLCVYIYIYNSAWENDLCLNYIESGERDAAAGSAVVAVLTALSCLSHWLP